MKKEGTGYKGIEKKSERKETIIIEILEQNPFFKGYVFGYQILFAILRAQCLTDVTRSRGNVFVSLPQD